MSGAARGETTDAKTRVFRMQLHGTLLQLLASLLPLGTGSSRMMPIALTVLLGENFV